MRRLALLLALATVAGCTAAAPPSPADRAATCAVLFARYDYAARTYINPRFGDGGTVPPGPLSLPSEQLRRAGCLTGSHELDGMPALARRLAPFMIADGGPTIRPTPVHVGIVTSIYDEGRATVFFRGLGYGSRGVGAEALGRRIYIGPFTTQGALDQALAVAREAGFIAPYAAKFTKF